MHDLGDKRKIKTGTVSDTMSQLRYSSDLAPAAIFLFPKLKTTLKDKDTIKEIKEKLKH